MALSSSPRPRSDLPESRDEGCNAAESIRKVEGLLEHPATLWMG